jgi:hypothetical protein
MEKYNITIRGITPLLMNRPGAEISDKSKNRKQGNETPKELAELKLYEIDGKLYQPATHIHGALIDAGKHKKVMGKGSSKATYSKVVGYAVEIEPFEIEHINQKWEVFSILAVNPVTHGRNMLHRPMLRNWELSFQVKFDDTEINSADMKELFDIAGRIVGIGDWRPAKKGRFGKFEVTSWKIAK